VFKPIPFHLPLSLFLSWWIGRGRKKTSRQSRVPCSKAPLLPDTSPWAARRRAHTAMARQRHCPLPLPPSTCTKSLGAWSGTMAMYPMDHFYLLFFWLTEKGRPFIRTSECGSKVIYVTVQSRTGPNRKWHTHTRPHLPSAPMAREPEGEGGGYNGRRPQGKLCCTAAFRR
jgi:hypothetical protein